MFWKWRPTIGPFVACAALLLGAALSVAQEQYPKPLIHTPADHPAQRVLLISIDGLHAFDLAAWVADHPASALAMLSARGVTYTNAHSPMPNPAAGLLALATGGTPISTGIVSGNGYDRNLSPPSSHCASRGTALELNDGFDRAGHGDPTKNPMNPDAGCAPVLPHQLLHVNTMFEVVHEKIGPTAWAGEDAATTDLLRGPSGKGVDDACGNRVPATDEERVNAVLHWIDGKNCDASADAPVPALMGLSMTSVEMAQMTKDEGYIDATGKPSDALVKSLASTDEEIGRLTEELKARHLFETTWIVVASPFGMAPVDPRQFRKIPLDNLRTAVNALHPGLVTHVTGGDTAMIWLRDARQTEEVARRLSDRAATLGIREITFGSKLALTLNRAANDARMPDVILQPQPGVIWATPKDAAVAAFGGAFDEDTHVAMLISGAQLTGRSDPTPVPITQLAPLLLRALGMEKFDLQALHKEHSPALPGIF